MNKILHFFDPHKQSFIFFKYTPLRLGVIITASIAVYLMRFRAPVKPLLYNVFVYLPNYLTHEFSHRFVCALTWRILPGDRSCWGGSDCVGLGQWLCVAAGNGVETLVPTVLFFLALRLKGGRMLTPFILYWISTTWYGAAVYVSDARAKLLHLTSSDMLTNHKPGEVDGDWVYILKPLGLLEYDLIIGYIFYFISAVCLVMALYGIWDFFINMHDYSKEDRGSGALADFPQELRASKEPERWQDKFVDPYAGDSLPAQTPAAPVPAPPLPQRDATPQQKQELPKLPPK